MKRRKSLKRNNVFKYIKKTLFYMFAQIKDLLLLLCLAVLIFQWLNINIFEAIGKKLDGFGTHDKLKPLEEDENARLTTNLPARRVHLQTKDGETKTYKGVRKFEATEMVDGSYTLDVKNKGLTLEPGFVTAVGDGLTFGPDLEFMYWKNFALAAGFTVPATQRKLDRIRGHLAVTYMPGFNIAPNTGIFGGIDTNTAPIFGVRIRF